MCFGGSGLIVLSVGCIGFGVLRIVLLLCSARIITRCLGRAVRLIVIVVVFRNPAVRSRRFISVILNGWLLWRLRNGCFGVAIIRCGYFVARCFPNRRLISFWFLNIIAVGSVGS